MATDTGPSGRTGVPPTHIAPASSFVTGPVTCAKSRASMPLTREATTTPSPRRMPLTRTDEFSGNAAAMATDSSAPSPVRVNGDNCTV
jgi:hypothetical protein